MPYYTANVSLSHETLRNRLLLFSMGDSKAVSCALRSIYTITFVLVNIRHQSTTSNIEDRLSRRGIEHGGTTTPQPHRAGPLVPSKAQYKSPSTRSAELCGSDDR